MIAVADAPEVEVTTEIRGAPANLWRGVTGEIVIAGSAGTGKTRAILEWIHDRCSIERVRVLMLRKTLESLKTSALVTYTDQVLQEFDGKRSDISAVSYFGGNRIAPAQFTYEETGSSIVLGGLDSPLKLRSTEYDVIYVNEANELTLDEWESLMYRTNRPKLGHQAEAIIIGDCNPDAPTHWIKQRAAFVDLKLWKSYHEDNPAMWDREQRDWTDSGRRYMATLDSLTGVRYQRLRLGNWVSAEGQVYEAWSERAHILRRVDVEERLQSAWRFGTADWGYTNPGVLSVWAVDHDGRLYLGRELYMTRKPVEGWWVPRAGELTDALDVSEWLCDPSEPAYIAQFNAAGLPARGAINAIMPGITAVQNRLAPQGDGAPRLFIADDCLIERDQALVETKRPWCTAQEIPEYVWPKDISGRPRKDKPVDANNHGLDALRYAVAHLDLGGAGSEFDILLAAAFRDMPS